MEEQQSKYVVEIPQTSYTVYENLIPQYQYVKIIPYGGTNVVTSNSGGQQILLNVGDDVANWHRGIIYCQLGIFDTGGAFGANANQLWMCAETLPLFNQVILQTPSNSKVIWINEAQNYVKIANKVHIKYDDFETYDRAVVTNPGGNSTTWSTAVVNNAGFTGFRGQKSDLILTGLSNHRFDNSLPQFASNEPLHFFATNATTNDGGRGTFILNCRINLSIFADTFFGVDKDFTFGQIMQLKFIMNPISKIYFTTVPVGGDFTNPTSGPLAPTVSINIQNFELYLPIEKNPNIVAQVRAKLMSSTGLSMLVPWVETIRQNIQQSTSQTVQIEFNGSIGRKLKRILYAPFDNTESANTAYDHSNVDNTGVAGAKIKSFRLLLNDKQTREYIIDCTNAVDGAQDYLEMSRYLVGSTLFSMNQYQANWFFIDDFSYAKQIGYDDPSSVDEANSFEGIPLDGTVKWTIQAITANVPLAHYVFAITEKMLTVTPGNVVCQ